MPPSTLQEQVRGIATTSAKIAMDDRRQRLIVTDTKESLAKIRSLIEKLDRDTEVRRTEVFELKHVPCEDVAEKAKPLISESGNMVIG